MTRVMRLKLVRRILAIAVPSMGSSLVYTLYSVVDLMWIGRLGTGAIASVTLALGVLGLTYILNEVFGVSSMILLSRRWGKGERDEYEGIVRQVLFYKVLVGITVYTLTVPFIERIITWMGGGVPSGGAVAYYVWRSPFLPVSFALGTMMTSFRAIGDTKTLFIVSSIGSAMNIFLDPIFMFWLGMGIKGSALASGMCEVLALIMGFRMLYSRWGVNVLGRVRPEIETLKKILILGVPALMDSVNWSVSNFITLKLVASLGVDATAVFGIFSRILEIIWMMGFALEGAVTTVVGHSLGRRDRKTAECVFKKGVEIALIMGGIVCAIVFTCSHGIVYVFTSDETLAGVASNFLKISSFGFISMFLLNVVYGALIGGGRTIDTLLIGAVGNWPIKLSAMWSAVTFGGDIEHVSVAFLIYIIVTSVLGVVFVLKSSRWLETEV